MGNNDFHKILSAAKIFYSEIGSIQCKHIDNQWINFGASGFKHLQMKKRKFRPIKEQIRKLLLLRHALEILNSDQVVIENRIANRNLIYKSISGKLNSRVVKVVIRKYTNGGYHFWSIMDK
jgi:hypothetical protein